MSRREEMAYYDIVGSEQSAIWEKYRQDLISHRKAAKELAISLGAGRFWLGMSGRICGAVFTEKRHAAFGAKQSRSGYYPTMAVGKTEAQKEAVAALKVENDALERLYRKADDIAKAEGFLCSIKYSEAGSEGFHGHRAIGDVWERAAACWTSLTSPIVLYATAPDIAIANERAAGRRAEPEEWAVPAGYVRILKEEWEMRLAKARLDKAKAGMEADGDE